MKQPSESEERMSDDDPGSDPDDDPDDGPDDDSGDDSDDSVLLEHLDEPFREKIHIFAQGIHEWLKTTNYRVPEQDRLALPIPRKVDTDLGKPKDYHFTCQFYQADPENH